MSELLPKLSNAELIELLEDQVNFKRELMKTDIDSFETCNYLEDIKKLSEKILELSLEVEVSTVEKQNPPVRSSSLLSSKVKYARSENSGYIDQSEKVHRLLNPKPTQLIPTKVPKGFNFQAFVEDELKSDNLN